MFPSTYEGVQIEMNHLLQRLEQLRLVEAAMDVDMEPRLEAVIPANDPSQETVKVSGNSMNTVVEEVIQEWERRHTKTRASRSGVYVFLEIGGTSVSVSVKDGFKYQKTIRQDTEDKTPRYRVVWSKTERSSAWLT